MGRRVEEFLAGCRDEAPLQLGVIPFGMLYGIGALAVGMPVWLAQLTSMLVFAGAAQLVIVQMLGAAAGASINYIFARYYQELARVQFGLLRLANETGIPREALAERLVMRIKSLEAKMLEGKRSA